MSVITRAAAVLAVLWFASPVSVSAEELWPASFDVQIEGGDEGFAELLLINDQKQNEVYTVELLHVQTSEAHEELTFSALPEEMSWIELDDDVLSLAADAQGTIGLSFHPPNDIHPQVLTIGVKVTRQRTSTDNVHVQAAIVALGFITVGSVEETVVLLDNSIESASGWSLPVTSYLTLRNEGERVVIPAGTMRVSRLFGREVAVEEINLQGSRVLAGQTRTFTTQWGTSSEGLSPWTVGIFDVEVAVSPWSEGDVFYARQRIVIFPWKGSLVLLVVISLIVWLHRFFRGPR